MITKYKNLPDLQLFLFGIMMISNYDHLIMIIIIIATPTQFIPISDSQRLEVSTRAEEVFRGF